MAPVLVPEPLAEVNPESYRPKVGKAPLRQRRYVPNCAKTELAESLTDQERRTQRKPAQFPSMVSRRECLEITRT